MMFSQQLFCILLISGLLLIGIEIFVPGGVIGVLGALALVGAIIAGFVAFPSAGIFIAVGILLLVGLVMLLWIRIFPNTSVGRQMTVSKNLSDAKAAQTGLADLIGKTGDAVTELRPAGFAMFDGQRVDVVTRGDMVERGTPVKVVAVEGNRVVVSKISAA